MKERNYYEMIGELERSFKGLPAPICSARARAHTHTLFPYLSPRVENDLLKVLDPVEEP